jgi:hypothetical protein
MTKKQWKGLLIRALRLYTLLVTLITILMIVLGNLLDRDRVFGYDAFFSPLLYALIGTAATLITRSDKELSVRSLIIRKIISLLLIEGAIIAIALKADTIPTGQAWIVPGLAAGILAVWLLSNTMMYVSDKREAERLTEELARYQKGQADKTYG